MRNTIDLNSLIVSTDKLNFSFGGSQKILEDLSLAVPKGSIYGFLGPNGAGKTTTIRLLLGLLKNQSGTIRLFGQDFVKNRIALLSRLGSLIEQPSLYLHLTGRENLEIFRLSYRCNKKRIGEVLDLVGLSQAANKKAKAYSLGMKQRLAIAISLMHEPELLILDEPTNGLDPTGIIETRELIKKLNHESGKTIIVSSHLLTEVEKMATHVGIINHGRLLFQGALTELQKLKSKTSAIELEVSDTTQAIHLLQDSFPLRKVNGSRLEVAFESRERNAEINQLLVQNGVLVYQMAVTQNDLESLFIQITNGNHGADIRA
jgi:lantibiotic transport system ATP-binding protein